MSTLIIILPADLPAPATPCEALLLDDSGHMAQHAVVPLDLLPASGNAEVVALVPAHKLSWHRLQLPRGVLGRGAPRLRAVLEGLLEERLLDEPAQLHFALAPQVRAGDETWVAACDRAWLQTWLTALEQAGRSAARVVPELAPPLDDAAPATLHVTGTPGQPLLLMSNRHGVTALPLTAATAALAAATELPATVLAEPAVAEPAEQLLQRSVTLQTRVERAAAAARSDWDLAQFELLRTRGTRLRSQLATLGVALLHAPRWRALRWAMLLLVVVNVAGLLTVAWQEQAAQTARRAAMREILTATFPDVRVVVDAPLQMARSLAALQRTSGAASGADLETLLARYQEAAGDAPPASGIEFAAGELQLKGLDPAAAGLEDITGRLRSRGYAARWEETTLFLRQEGAP